METTTMQQRIDELEVEVAQLRRDLEVLRDALAIEVRTRRVVIEADGHRTEVKPDGIHVSHEASGTFAGLTVCHNDYASIAEVQLYTGDVPGGDGADHNAALVVQWPTAFIEDGADAFLDINGGMILPSPLPDRSYRADSEP
jgi:hypothetical protein